MISLSSVATAQCANILKNAEGVRSGYKISSDIFATCMLAGALFGLATLCTKNILSRNQSIIILAIGAGTGAISFGVLWAKRYQPSHDSQNHKIKSQGENSNHHDSQKQEIKPDNHLNPQTSGSSPIPKGHVVLRNGGVISQQALTTISMNLSAMKTTNRFAFGDLVAKCKDNTFVIENDFLGKPQVLKAANLLESDGSISNAVRDVVLCSVTETLEFQSPLQQK